MSVQLEMLRVFQVVAEEGTLAKASAILHRTPSALSMTLSQLQDELGAELFETNRKNKLTPFGKQVLQEAARATEAFDRSTAVIRRHAKATAGLVRVAAVPSVMLELLPRVVAQFHRQRPNIRLEISDVNTDAIKRRLSRDEADIGIISSQPDNPSQLGTVIERQTLGIACQRDGAIAQALAAGANPSWELLKLEALIDNPLCRFIAFPRMTDWRLEATFEVRNTTTLLALVEHGLGATILPENVVSRKQERLLYFVPEDPVAWRELRKVHSSERQLSPAARALWELIKAES